MKRDELKTILPHREPMLLIDEAEKTDANTATGRYTVKGDEWFLQGHFPGNPVVPGVVLCEIMAQTCCVLLAEVNNAKKTPYFTGLNKVKFKQKVLPGRHPGNRMQHYPVQTTLLFCERFRQGEWQGCCCWRIFICPDGLRRQPCLLKYSLPIAEKSPWRIIRACKEMGHRHRSGLLKSGRRQSSCELLMRAFVLDRRRLSTVILISQRFCQPPYSPEPKRFTRVTAFFLRTLNLPDYVPSAGLPLSDRPGKLSRRWATKTRPVQPCPPPGSPSFPAPISWMIRSKRRKKPMKLAIPCLSKHDPAAVAKAFVWSKIQRLF